MWFLDFVGNLSFVHANGPKCRFCHASTDCKATLRSRACLCILSVDEHFELDNLALTSLPGIDEHFGPSVEKKNQAQPSTISCSSVVFRGTYQTTTDRPSQSAGGGPGPR